MADPSKHIKDLYSPPTSEPMDSFSQPSSPAIANPKANMASRSLSFSRHPPSPQSPETSTLELANKFRSWSAEHLNGRPVIANPDPILYPDRRQSIEYKSLFGDENSSSGKLPLPSPPLLWNQQPFNSPNGQSPATVLSDAITPTSFVSATSAQTEEARIKNAVIEDHYKTRVLSHVVQPKSKVTKWSTAKTPMFPSREDYELVMDVAFQSSIYRDFNSNMRAYGKRQRMENDEDYYYARKRNHIGYNHTALLKAKEDKPSTIAVVQSSRVRKPAKKQVDKRSGTPEVKHRRTAVKKTKALFHYNDIPNYSPSNDTIPGDKNFRVTWNGQPLDLSEDPDRELLHPAEIQLASKLRFPCSQYLKTKRRVFVGRVNNLIKHPNKQFCKTDAQQVGGVDVNKLSQLWEAYNSIGWFHESHFKKHVEVVRNATSVYDPKNTKWVDHKDLFGF